MNQPEDPFMADPDDYDEAEDAGVEYTSRIMVAMEVLKLYPFRFNVVYDKPTQELIDVARGVIQDFLAASTAAQEDK